MAERVLGAFEKLTLHIQELIALAADAQPGEVAALVGVTQRAANAMDELQRRVALAAAEADRWALDGFRSPATWIALHSGLPRPDATKRWRHAQELRAMPATRRAAAEGTLHQRHVDELVKAKRRAPDHYTTDIDEALAALASTGELDQFAEAVRAWHQHCDALEPAGASIPEPALAGRFTLAGTLDGIHHGTLTLGLDDAQLVNAAIDQRVSRFIQQRRDGDPTLDTMTLANLRAQALVDLCAADLRRHPGDRSRPDRHHIALTMHVTNDGELARVGSFPPAATCDSSIYRLVLGAAGQVLDVGQAQRTWPTPIANAIIRRDRHCTFPGCDAPPHHCDIHHCHHWEHGGPTAVTNGTLLCRWHHTFIHRHRWHTTLDHRQHPHFWRSEGPEHTVRTQRPRPSPPTRNGPAG